MREKFLDVLKGGKGHCALRSIRKVCEGDGVGDVDGVTGNDGLGHRGSKLPVWDDNRGFSNVWDVSFHSGGEEGRARARGFGGGERRQLGEDFGMRGKMFIRRWRA